MTRSACCRWLLAALLFVAPGRSAFAQDAVTVTGHVQSGGRPVQGAAVRIPDLNLGALTDVDGRYTFIVPSSRVRGQTVAITARHLRSRTVTDSISLTGGSVVKDFNLDAVEVSSPQGDSNRSPNARAPATIPGATAAQIPGASARGAGAIAIDSSAFDDLAGATDFGSALAGRLAGLRVATASSPGGSTLLGYRGVRTIAGTSAPLVVLDGIPLDQTTFSDVGQRFGFGGFDYGNSVDDLNPADIRQVSLVSAQQGTSIYGARAANGVIVVTTKNGTGLNGYEVTLSQRVTGDAPVRLPSFQNAYGQGSNGQFSFFDGSGGGVNDGIAESWGPALNGQPITQASLTEAKRPDVRYFLPQPDNVSSYFAAGRTLTSDAALASGGIGGNLRVSLRSRATTGVTPGSSFDRRGATVTGQRQLTSHFDVTAHLQYDDAIGHSRAGTGVDDANPMASLVTTPRQVDVAALKAHLRDAAAAQINWIYTNRNNPYFSALENSNHDSRGHLIAGGSAVFAPSSTLNVTANVGQDSYDESRHVTIAPGWLGGFASANGRGDFVTGGFQNQDAHSAATDAQLAVTSSGHRYGAMDLSLTAGAEWRRTTGRTSTVVSDTAAVAGDSAATANASVPSAYSFTAQTTAFFGSVTAKLGQSASIATGLRREQSDVFASSQSAHIYPFVIGQWAPALGRARDLTIHGAWSQSAADLTPGQIRNVYGGTQSPDGVTFDTASTGRGAALAPEITSGFEGGADFNLFARRLGVGITAYHDRTDGVVIAAPAPTGLGVDAVNGAVVSNTGVDGYLSLLEMKGGTLEWSTLATYGFNRNRVESFSGIQPSAALGPTRWGVTLEALPGHPLGVLVGSAFLRDGATNQLLLKNGLPVADTAPLHVLGAAQPKWFGGISNTFQYRRLQLSVLFDGQFGGRIFSASNMLGAVSGNLAETAFRPDSGLVIAGIDAATGTVNTTHVSTENYYHALGAIAERWVYSADFVKLRDLRVGTSVDLPGVGSFHAPRLSVSLIGRNLARWSKAPNIDPEAAISSSTFQGFELGQLPMTRSVGVQLSIVP